MEFTQQHHQAFHTMFAHSRKSSEPASAAAPAPTSLLSMMCNSATAQPSSSSKHGLKISVPQHTDYRYYDHAAKDQHYAPPTSLDSPDCVSSCHYPAYDEDPSSINGAAALQSSMSPIDDLGDFYNQATWRMYERIHTARQDLKEYYHQERQQQQYGGGMATLASQHMLPSIGSSSGPRNGLPRLQPRRDYPQEEDEYLEDTIFEMDL